jgi:hypothetical protein
VWRIAPASSPAAVLTSNRAVAGETFAYPASVDQFEHLLAYRVDESNLEQAMIEASRPALVKYHAELLRAKRSTEPQVLVRPGIGRVTAVGGVPFK